MKRLLIIGAGGHGKAVAEAAERSGWSDIRFLDAAWPELKSVSCWAVVGKDSDFRAFCDGIDGLIVAIGNNQIRTSLLRQLQRASAPLINIIDPSALVSKRAVLGEGVMVLAGAVVNIDAQLGDGVIVNTACVVEHDCCVSDGVHIAPGAVLGGAVDIGQMCLVGLGARLLPGVRVAELAIIAAGAVVNRDVAAGQVVKGVPAK